MSHPPDEDANAEKLGNLFPPSQCVCDRTIIQMGTLRAKREKDSLYVTWHVKPATGFKLQTASQSSLLAQI